MTKVRPRRGVISLLSKAHEALAEASIYAAKIERGHNLQAAKEFSRCMREFRDIHTDGLYRRSKEIVSDIKQRPKRKVSLRQITALQKTRSKRKYNQKK